MSDARKFISQALSIALLGLVIAAGLALIIVPKVAGARPLTILSGSMTGTYDVGDVVVVKPVKVDTLQIGDVITFQPFSDDPSLTTHRIVGVAFGSNGREFVTQGDANNAPDLKPISADQVKGEVWYSVPKVGYASVWFAGHLMRTVTDMVGIGLLLYAGVFIAGGLRERRRKSTENEDPSTPSTPSTAELEEATA
jgi:signal peptidase